MKVIRLSMEHRASRNTAVANTAKGNIERAKEDTLINLGFSLLNLSFSLLWMEMEFDQFFGFGRSRSKSIA